MNPRFVDFLLKNHFLSSVASFVVLLLAVATSSLALLVLSGVIAYGWPIFYVYLLDTKEGKTTAKSEGAISRNVAAAHSH